MQVQEGAIKRLVLLGSTIVIITITIAISFFLISSENHSFQEEVQRIEEELTFNRQRAIENRLQSLLSEITFDHSLMRDLQLEEVKNTVRMFHVSLSNLSSSLSPKMLYRKLQKHVFSKSLHGFALDENGTLLWNSRNPNTEGENIYHAQDMHNHFYIQEIIQKAKEGNESPITFSWYTPQQTSISTNIVYVRYLPHLRLIVGAFRSEESIDQWIQQTILKKMSTHHFGKDSLFFIDYLHSYTMRGNFSTPLLTIGESNHLAVLKDKETQTLIGNTFLAQGFKGIHAHTFMHESQPYLLTTTILPKWRWIIGLGENLNALSLIKTAQLKRAKTNRDIKILQLTMLTLGIAFIFYLLSHFLARKVEELLIDYKDKATMESNKYQALYQHSNDSFILARESDLNIVDANLKASDLTALVHDDLLYTPLSRFLPNLNFQTIKQESSGYERTLLIDYHGVEKIVEFSFVWIYLNKERIIFASIRDITERMRLISDRRKQEQLLIQQSKMAAMGEMIGNIAHQWRQPLTQLSGLFMDLDSAYTHKELTKAYMNKSIDEANDIIEYMSHTIDDFRNFFDPNKNKEEFLPSHALRKTLKVINSSFKEHAITLHVNVVDEHLVLGYENEYAQVVLNILNNAKDILIEREIATPMISIKLDTKGDKTSLQIHDNGGGIKEEYLDRIFEPYFTTKFNYGTGIGLYMSKIIIEKNMHGQISVKNEKDGATFIITL